MQNAINFLNNEAGIPLGVLATRCGFSGTRQLNAAFRRETGSTAKVFYHQQKAE